MSRLTCIRISVSIITILLLLVASYSYFFALVPLRIAEFHEAAYFEKRFPLYDSTSDPQNGPAGPPNKPLLPLIPNVFQLSSFSWERDLQLNLDGTAQYPMQQRWVYAGGTPQLPRSWREKTSLFSPPNKGSCVDSPSVCSDFNSAFTNLAQTARGRHSANPIRPSLYFFDCDHSPLLCDVFRINPVMLLHLETKPPCFARSNYTFVCSKRWTYISLPLKKMPFERKVSINGLLVPAFPSALEQLRSVMVFEGGLHGLGLDKNAYRETLVGNEGDGFTFEGVMEEDSDLYEHKLQEVADFLSIVLGERQRLGQGKKGRSEKEIS